MGRNAGRWSRSHPGGVPPVAAHSPPIGSLLSPTHAIAVVPTSTKTNREVPLHALKLRRWALACLSTSRPEATCGDRAALNEISPAAWSVFLAGERCAVPLAARLDRVPRGLPDHARDSVAVAATAELKRILAARAQLQTLSTVARDTGCRPVLLKGGVVLPLADRSYDLDDLDLLLPPREAARFVAALDAAGYRPLVGSGSRRHLAVRSARGALHVEVHVAGSRDEGLPHGTALEDVRPIPGAPALVRLAPPEHAWSILVHVTVDHTERRGRIRDVLLLADAIAECAPEDRARLARRAATHWAGDVMNAQLAMARALSDGAEPVDAFEGIALTNYVLRQRTGGIMDLPGNVPVTASNLVFAILGGRTERRGFWARETSIPMEPSRFSFIAWVQRRYRRLGGLWLLFFRLLRLPVALVLAAPLVLAARRALRRAGLVPRIG